MNPPVTLPVDRSPVNRPPLLQAVVVLLALASAAGIAVNVWWFEGLMAFLRRGDGLASAGVTEEAVQAGLLGGVLSTYGALLLILVFVWRGHGWARFGWLAMLAFALLTELPWMYLHWAMNDLFETLDAAGGRATSRSLPMLYTPPVFQAKVAVLSVLVAGSPGLLMPVVGRWMARRKASAP